MLHVAIKYATVLGQQMRNFKVKSNNPYVANFSCPLCGDSVRNKRKARGFLYTKKGSMSYFCHNCGGSMSLKNFLKEVDPSLHSRYAFEMFQENNAPRHSNNAVQTTVPLAEERTILDELLDRVDNLPDNHPANVYLRDRLFPMERRRELYWIDDVTQIENLSPKFAEKIESVERRILIPSYSRDCTLLALSARSIDPSEKGLRYVTINISNRPDQRTFSLDRVDFSKTVYVCEGYFDSVFLPNAIAFGNASLHLVRNSVQYDVDVVLVYDNEPRNREVVKLMNKGVENFPVVVWPDNINQKDINQMIVDKVLTVPQLHGMVRDRTFSGLSARMAFNEWKRV